MAKLFLLLVSLLLVANAALAASFNSTYLYRSGKSKFCSNQANLMETNLTDTQKSMDITIGKCQITGMIFNETNVTNGEFAHFLWNGTHDCAGESLDFARLHCHHDKLDSILDRIRRRNDRCYLDIGTVSGDKCVYENRGKWNFLDWLFPIAILVTVFAFTCFCCFKNKMRKASRPRGPILDTDPEHPDAAYDDRNSPFQ